MKVIEQQILKQTVEFISNKTNLCSVQHTPGFCSNLEQAGFKTFLYLYYCYTSFYHHYPVMVTFVTQQQKLL